MIASLWLGSARQRPARALGTILGVALGVASVVGTGLASRAAVASMTRDVEELAGDAQLEVTQSGGVPLAELERLRDLCGLVRIRPVVEDVALYAPGAPAPGPGGPGEPLRLLGIDLLEPEEAGGGTLESAGRTPPELLAELLFERAVALTPRAAADLGLEVGDELEVVVDSRPARLRLAALWRPARFAAAWDRTLIADIALAQELGGRGERVDRLELVPRTGAGGDELPAEELARRVREHLWPGAHVAPTSERREQGERLVRSLAFNLTALAGVSVLVGVVLVATTLATSVVRRRRTLAVLRSLGASRSQLALAVLLEATLIGLAGGLLGVLLGAWVARALAAGVHGSVATLAEGALLGAVELEPAWLLTGVLLGLGTALAAAFLPLQEVWRTPPVQGLRAEAPDAEAHAALGPRLLLLAALAGGAWLCTRLPPWDGRPVWALCAALLLLSLQLVAAQPSIDLLARLPVRLLGTRLATPFLLAQAGLAAARRRAAWAAGAVGVAVALAVSMAVLVGSFRHNVVDWTAQTLRSDLYLHPLATGSGSSPGRIAPEVVEIARELFGAENVDPFHETSAAIGNDVFRLGGAAFSVVAREGGVPFLDGRPSTEVFAEALARGGAVANEPFARRFGLHAGERVRFESAAGPVERVLIGVYRDFSGHDGRLVLDLADYLGLQPDEGPESVAVFLPAGSEVEHERGRLAAALAGRFRLEILNNREVRGEVLRLFERTFQVTVGLEALASVVAALAVVLVLSALVRERVRDLAVVRVLGGSQAQLLSLVASQALLLGLAGTLGGVLVGGLVGYLLVTVVNLQSFGWSLDFAPPAAAFWGALAVLPTCAAAGLFPAWLSLRARPQEALRELD